MSKSLNPFSQNDRIGFGKLNTSKETYSSTVGRTTIVRGGIGKSGFEKGNKYYKLQNAAKIDTGGFAKIASGVNNALSGRRDSGVRGIVSQSFSKIRVGRGIASTLRNVGGGIQSYFGKRIARQKAKTGIFGLGLKTLVNKRLDFEKQQRYNKAMAAQEAERVRINDINRGASQALRQVKAYSRKKAESEKLRNLAYGEIQKRGGTVTSRRDVEAAVRSDTERKNAASSYQAKQEAKRKQFEQESEALRASRGANEVAVRDKNKPLRESAKARQTSEFISKIGLGNGGKLKPTVAEEFDPMKRSKGISRSIKSFSRKLDVEQAFETADVRRSNKAVKMFGGNKADILKRNPLYGKQENAPKYVSPLSKERTDRAKSLGNYLKERNTFKSFNQRMRSAGNVSDLRKKNPNYKVGTITGQRALFSNAFTKYNAPERVAKANELKASRKQNQIDSKSFTPTAQERTAQSASSTIKKQHSVARIDSFRRSVESGGSKAMLLSMKTVSTNKAALQSAKDKVDRLAFKGDKKPILRQTTESAIASGLRSHSVDVKNKMAEMKAAAKNEVTGSKAVNVTKKSGKRIGGQVKTRKISEMKKSVKGVKGELLNLGFKPGTPEYYRAYYQKIKRAKLISAGKLKGGKKYKNRK